MLKVGITGGIGAGKSIVCKIFSKWQIPVFIADEVAKNLMLTDNDLITQIKELFGEKAYNSNGKLNSSYISSVVFNNDPILKQLNALVHPFVQESFQKWLLKHNSPYVIEEAAILFESGAYKSMDKTIMVFSDKQTRINRIIKRNGFSKEKIEKIMSAQFNDEEKCKKADYTIYNNEKTLLLPQILKIHNELISI